MPDVYRQYFKEGCVYCAKTGFNIQGMMKRLFIAVPICEKSRTDIAGKILSNTALRQMPVRWTAVQNLHLTLQFLGDTEEKRIQEIKRIMDNCRTCSEAEKLCFSSAGAFPARNSPRILWIGFMNNEYLQIIHRDLTAGLNAAGFSVDNKKFKPHLTLGRVKDQTECPPDLFTVYKNVADSAEISDSPLDRITLFESFLRPGGSVYTALYDKMLV